MELLGFAFVLMKKCLLKNSVTDEEVFIDKEVFVDKECLLMKKCY